MLRIEIVGHNGSVANLARDRLTVGRYGCACIKSFPVVMKQLSRRSTSCNIGSTNADNDDDDDDDDEEDDDDDDDVCLQL